MTKGTIFDNIIITDDLKEAEQHAAEHWKPFLEEEIERLTRTPAGAALPVFLDAASALRYIVTSSHVYADALAPTLRSVMEARLKRDAALALSVWEADAELDELHTEAHARILKFMRKNPDQLEDAAHLLMIAKNFERIGDHCTNIAEEIHFHILGEAPPDNRPKTDEVGK